MLPDALRYVPGVNIHANEDTSQRNQFYVRGFSAESDRYLDGMLEIGNWYMDTFDMERLEVLEGPAGVLFGRGSTGGVVNYVSKAPSLSPLTEVGDSFGTDGTKRASVDFNRVGRRCHCAADKRRWLCPTPPAFCKSCRAIGPSI